MAKRNPYFKFQQFTVYHSKCAMKVGTDGTILGAWVNVSNTNTALDIGTGTGLIALMMAQKSKHLQIKAIDIESSAIEQAQENINSSPFSDRITLEQIALQEYHRDTKFDVIVSNPPYFTETLKSPDKKRAVARHADSLSAEELISFASAHLRPNGRLSTIYPIEYKERLITLGKENDLHPTRITDLYPTAQSNPRRVLIEFSRQEHELIESNLTIEVTRHQYSDEFKELVKDFYLKEFID